MADAEVIRIITEGVDDAIRKNRRIETILIVVLFGLTASGIVLFILGVLRQDLTITIPGGVFGLLVVMPVRSLIQLRRDNIRLAVFPLMLQLADAKSEKKLVVKFLETLINQVGP